MRRLLWFFAMVYVVEGLGESDARSLLESVLTGPLDVRVREQIVSETRGNPLALLELLRGLTPAQLAGGFALPGAAPLSRSIEESSWCWSLILARSESAKECRSRTNSSAVTPST